LPSGEVSVARQEVEVVERQSFFWFWFLFGELNYTDSDVCGGNLEIKMT
jgi:hypothetical protein